MRHITVFFYQLQKKMEVIQSFSATKMASTLFWDISRLLASNPYRRFGKTCLSNLEGQDGTR
jgi:hypothetical protein